MAANQDTSKKQSGASLSLPPEDCPDPKEIQGMLMDLPGRVVFFVDRSLGRKIIPGALRDAGEEVRIHDEHFPQDAKDEVWLAEAGKQGWVVLTKDKNIRYGRTPSVACRQSPRLCPDGPRRFERRGSRPNLC